MSPDMLSLSVGIVAAFAMLAYLVPAVIATARHHHNAGAIFALNLLLGWTLLGWVGALVWACTAVQYAENGA